MKTAAKHSKQYENSIWKNRGEWKKCLMSTQINVGSFSPKQTENRHEPRMCKYK